MKVQFFPSQPMNDKISKDEYNKDPKRCYCGNPIPYKYRNVSKFCSSSCSAKYSNQKRAKPKGNCPYCGKTLPTNQAKFCSRECFLLYNERETKEKFYRGELDDENARHYFRKISEKKCSICGIDKWNGEDAPLIVDHIDGDYKNNSPTNFRMVCCNCEAQLPTHGSKNRGNGRAHKRKGYRA
jgi:predicted nucleic acid-binding Zn ribbon protein